MSRFNHVPQVERYAVSAGLHTKTLTFIRPQRACLSILNERPLDDFRPLSVSLGKSTADVLIWSDWDIIFAYTTYFTGAIQHDHFMQLAADVVQSGLAVVSHYSEGFLIWKSQSIHAEPFDIHREPFVRPRTVEFTFPDGLGPYQMQCALHAAQMRFFEHHYVSPMVAKELLYFKAFLEPCELKTEGKHIRLYPSLTVHQNGVFQMHFRLMSNGNLISTRELIDDFLNSSMAVATDILVPPALMKLDGRKLIFEDDYYESRRSALRQWRRLENLIARSVNRVEGGPDSFDHDLISLDPEGKGEGAPMSLTTVTTMLSNALTTLLNQPRMGWRYRLLGPKKARYEQGEFWRGTPNVYLLSVRNHPLTASDIHSRYAAELGHIMSRSKDIPGPHAQKHLGESLRSAEDYLSYTGQALNLFVYSRSGRDGYEGDDPNANELIYALQSHVDLVDFINGSLWQCEERALLHAHTVEELITNRKRQTLYDYASRRPFHFGELNDWFTEVQKAHNIEATRAAIAFNTTLNLEKFKERRNFKRQQFQWLMAALLGVIAAGTSGGKLVSLFWEGAGGLPQSELRYALVAMTVVAMVFLAAYKGFVEPIGAET
ncbi:hypothetical protein [Deinococcus aquaedulcis]|uniref:hypothetical protein n=1 Tax=Deinococcus aquaedulcis TaxID=2840455 RepID=UPI001C82FB58|nr:hypothetical protein [Deinococcus aquaedulcis]